MTMHPNNDDMTAAMERLLKQQMTVPPEHMGPDKPPLFGVSVPRLLNDHVADSLQYSREIANHGPSRIQQLDKGISQTTTGIDAHSHAQSKKFPEVAFSGDTFVLDTAIAAALQEKGLYLKRIHDQVKEEVVKNLHKKKLTTIDYLISHIGYKDLGIVVRVCSNGSGTKVLVEVAEADPDWSLGSNPFGDIDDEYLTT